LRQSVRDVPHHQCLSRVVVVGDFFNADCAALVVLFAFLRRSVGTLIGSEIIVESVFSLMIFWKFIVAIEVKSMR